MSLFVAFTVNKIEGNGGYASMSEIIKNLIISKDGQSMTLTGDEAAKIYNAIRPSGAPRMSIKDE